MSVTVGMPGISHFSTTKQLALAMLHQTPKDSHDMWAMSDEESDDFPLNLVMNTQCCELPPTA